MMKKFEDRHEKNELNYDLISKSTTVDTITVMSSHESEEDNRHDTNLSPPVNEGLDKDKDNDHAIRFNSDDGDDGDGDGADAHGIDSDPEPDLRTIRFIGSNSPSASARHSINIISNSMSPSASAVASNQSFTTSAPTPTGTITTMAMTIHPFILEEEKEIDEKQHESQIHTLVSSAIDAGLNELKADAVLLALTQFRSSSRRNSITGSNSKSRRASVTKINEAESIEGKHRDEEKTGEPLTPAITTPSLSGSSHTTASTRSPVVTAAKSVATTPSESKQKESISVASSPSVTVTSAPVQPVPPHCIQFLQHQFRQQLQANQHQNHSSVDNGLKQLKLTLLQHRRLDSSYCHDTSFAPDSSTSNSVQQTPVTNRSASSSSVFSFNPASPGTHTSAASNSVPFLPPLSCTSPFLFMFLDRTISEGSPYLLYLFPSPSPATISSLSSSRSLIPLSSIISILTGCVSSLIGEIPLSASLLGEIESDLTAELTSPSTSADKGLLRKSERRLVRIWSRDCGRRKEMDFVMMSWANGMSEEQGKETMERVLGMIECCVGEIELGMFKLSDEERRMKEKLKNRIAAPTVSTIKSPAAPTSPANRASHQRFSSSIISSSIDQNRRSIIASPIESFPVSPSSRPSGVRDDFNTSPTSSTNSGMIEVTEEESLVGGMTSGIWTMMALDPIFRTVMTTMLQHHPPARLLKPNTILSHLHSHQQQHLQLMPFVANWLRLSHPLQHQLQLHLTPLLRLRHSSPSLSIQPAVPSPFSLSSFAPASAVSSSASHAPPPTSSNPSPVLGLILYDRLNVLSVLGENVIAEDVNQVTSYLMMQKVLQTRKQASELKVVDFTVWRASISPTVSIFTPPASTNADLPSLTPLRSPLILSLVCLSSFTLCLLLTAPPSSSVPSSDPYFSFSVRNSLLTIIGNSGRGGAGKLARRIWRERKWKEREEIRMGTDERTGDTEPETVHGAGAGVEQLKRSDSASHNSTSSSSGIPSLSAIVEENRPSNFSHVPSSSPYSSTLPSLPTSPAASALQLPNQNPHQQHQTRSQSRSTSQSQTHLESTSWSEKPLVLQYVCYDSQSGVMVQSQSGLSSESQLFTLFRSLTSSLRATLLRFKQLYATDPTVSDSQTASLHSYEEPVTSASSSESNSASSDIASSSSAAPASSSPSPSAPISSPSPSPSSCISHDFQSDYRRHRVLESIGWLNEAGMRVEWERRAWWMRGRIWRDGREMYVAVEEEALKRPKSRIDDLGKSGGEEDEESEFEDEEAAMNWTFQRLMHMTTLTTEK